MTINLSVTDKGEDQNYISDENNLRQNQIIDDFSESNSVTSDESSFSDDNEVNG